MVTLEFRKTALANKGASGLVRSMHSGTVVADLRMEDIAICTLLV